MVRTHLPSPLIMNIETQRLQNFQQVELLGKGVEQQLHMMGGDMTHQVTFQIR